MKKIGILIIVFAGAISAQTNPMIAEVKTNYAAMKTNITKGAEKMPEAGYTSQPTPEERTFAALIGHIADAQTRICSAATGEAKPATAAKLTEKAALLEALKASFDVCDQGLASLTDDNAGKMMSFMGRGERSKIGILNYNVIHDNESYGTMAVYLRLKGVVPPSSEPKK